MECIIRLATNADIAAMHAIRLAVRENRLAEAGIISLDSYQPYVDDRAVWVAVAAGRIAGFAALVAAGASVWALFVDPAAEGLVIGRALHRHLLAAAATRDLRRLHLTTSPGTRAADFYRAAGWMESGMTDGELRFTRSVPDPARPVRP